ncbi:MAG: putative neutral zinc metallopeptidase [Chloroflexi bacterium ADurb.Bin180]|nr:MAG: putative neutral zinc metallopeptidase [Chloroflexi bacterium ADurb.Bin180]HNR96885.1 zinc metallopeptidase [Anaerolineae bacterium]HNT05700.1 zinc metallopeptidase [Anaerolineae bacterium]HOU24943.1 zinc metallopeptidase [Anaerolineae bacterium]HQJ51408.1 zinc metallopeptidase [Anaerolineae bacterium]
MYWNPMYFVFALPALLLGMYAQFKIRSAYGKYTQVGNALGITGVEAAQRLLASNGLEGVQLEGTPGELTDHYDPGKKRLALSRDVAYGRSLAGLAIVAHEVGHAVQDHTNYPLMKLRNGIVPMVQVGSALGPIVFILGYMFGASGLALLGLLLFSASAVFALLTLPVEMDASARALQMLTTNGLLVQRDETAGAKSVLDAAALTYVAALLQVLSTLLYYVFLLSGSSRRRN